MSRWVVDCRVGDAAALHEFEPPDRGRATLVVAQIERPALVLGSTQPIDVVDQARADTAGLEVVRRRSGGSSVLLVPGDHVWIDVWIPAGDPMWLDDVAAAAVPVGHAWVRALGVFGWTGLTAHTGGAEAADWSDLVCFAGRGPGEVFTADDRKLVGLSQRRTRDWIRMQCLVHRRWSAVEALEGLALGPAERSEAEVALGNAVAALGAIDGEAVVDALHVALH